MIDTEIKLRGSAAKEFHKMMTSMDIDSLHARDKFISNLFGNVIESENMTIPSKIIFSESVIENSHQRIPAICFLD